jgi:hypothetical protein
MKRKLFSLLTLLMVVCSVQAAIRSLKQMKDAAAVVLHQSSNVSTRAISSDIEIIKDMNQLSVIGYDNGPFAVIAKNDQFEAVLGYTDSPTLSAIEDNQNFMWWLTAMNETLSTLASEGESLKKVTPSNKYSSAVSPILTTEWGQSSPYNNQTPTYSDGTHYVTGCVATAMAQIMKFHNWPVKGKGTVSYRFQPENGEPTQRVSVNFSQKNYDWTNMLDEYPNGSYTTEEADAVSMLMFHCGASVLMQYTTTGSGSYTFTAADALRDHFYYDANPKFYARDYMTVDEWMDIIFNELSSNRPILYGGQSSSGGHEFVLDGYDADGKVHVNWGWNGSQNGYFEIASLNGFSSSQDMLCVRKDNTEFQSLLGYSGSLSVTLGLTGTTLNYSGTLVNINIDNFDGSIALFAQDINNTNTAPVQLDITSGTINGYGYDKKISSFQISGTDVSVSDLTEGTYRLYLASKTSQDSNWQPVRAHEDNTNSYILTLTNGKISLQDEANPSWPSGINTIKMTFVRPADDAIYSITGVKQDNRINQLPAGIYIRNGKKFVVK